MAEHTPKPWTVESDGCYPVVRKRFRADHHMEVCGPVHGYMYSADEKGEQAANARLIAAAPELLDACKAAEDFIATIDGDAALAIYDQLHAAISKATGAPQ